MLAALLLLATAPLSDDADFQAAVALYNDVEIEKAAAAFALLVEDERWTQSERAHLYAWQGLSLAQLGRSEPASTAFLAAARLDPEVSLPAPAPPQIEELLQKARGEAAAEVPVAAPAAPSALENESAPPPASASLPWPWFAGGTVAIVGLCASLGGASLAALSFATEQQAYDATFADEAVALADAADAQRVAGTALLVMGTAVLGSGVALAFLPVE